jgi:threonine/homoserine/homoserine lactone efflux protein
MNFNLILTGIIVGFLVAMPVGPIGILIIQRTVNKSRLSGLISGLGAALADTFYAVIAGYSLTFIIELVRQNQILFQLTGGLAVIGLGLHIFFKNPVRDFKRFKKKGNTPVQDLTSTFLLTLANPITIFAFIALLASSGAVFNMERPYQTLFMVTGVFIGAGLWWFSLTEIINLFKHRFNLRVLWWFNKIAGIAILFFVVISLTYALITDIRI